MRAPRKPPARAALTLLAASSLALAARAVVPENVPMDFRLAPGEAFGPNLKAIYRMVLIRTSDPRAGGRTTLAVEITHDPDDGPAKTAGLEAGDLILLIEGSPILLPAPGTVFDLDNPSAQDILVWDHGTRREVTLRLNIP